MIFLNFGKLYFVFTLLGTKGCPLQFLMNSLEAPAGTRGYVVKQEGNILVMSIPETSTGSAALVQNVSFVSNSRQLQRITVTFYVEQTKATGALAYKHADANGFIKVFSTDFRLLNTVVQVSSPSNDGGVEPVTKLVFNNTDNQPLSIIISDVQVCGDTGL